MTERMVVFHNFCYLCKKKLLLWESNVYYFLFFFWL